MSSSLSKEVPSSTVITPSLPTLSIASAMMSPTLVSEFAEIVPTCAMASVVAQGFDNFASAATAAMVALSIPRFRSIGFIPADTDFMPSRTMPCARTVAVVVPSPAMSDVCDETSFTICAPMFSKRSSSSISLATETPSLVMVGAPNDFSKTTLRPLGPNVTFTALARTFTPLTMRLRESSPKRTSFADISKFL